MGRDKMRRGEGSASHLVCECGKQLDVAVGCCRDKQTMHGEAARQSETDVTLVETSMYVPKRGLVACRLTQRGRTRKHSAEQTKTCR